MIGVHNVWVINSLMLKHKTDISKIQTRHKRPIESITDREKEEKRLLALQERNLGQK